MIWMDPGSLVIEVCAPGELFSSKLNLCYEKLADALGHRFVRVIAQKNWVSDVNCNLILQILEKEMNPI
jgi:hypothetical protein